MKSLQLASIYSPQVPSCPKPCQTLLRSRLVTASEVPIRRREVFLQSKLPHSSHWFLNFLCLGSCWFRTLALHDPANKDPDTRSRSKSAGIRTRLIFFVDMEPASIAKIPVSILRARFLVRGVAYWDVFRFLDSGDPSGDMRRHVYSHTLTPTDTLSWTHRRRRPSHKPQNKGGLT